MILIADSGSTKCDWALLGDDIDIRFTTEGLNPFFCNQDKIQQVIEDKLLYLINDHRRIDTVRFFGSGCRGEKKKVVEEALYTCLSDAKIFVENDITGAAIALFGDEKGIASIIGTGSVASFFDGEKITDGVSSLGYILGDEASGAALGKKIVSDYFKNKMPDDIKKKFFNRYNIKVDEILDRVYSKPFPNRFLASFSPFLSENISNSYIYNIVFDSFVEFLDRNVMQIQNYNRYKVSFCGSVAYHFADILEIVCIEMNLNIGKIIHSPIDYLAKYYMIDIMK